MLTLAREKPDDAEAKIEGIVKDLGPEDKPEFMKEVQLQYSALSEEVRAVIAGNLNKLVETSTGTALASLKTEVDAMAVAKKPEGGVMGFFKGAAGGTGEALKSGVDKTKEALGKVPWGNVAFVGVGVVGVGLLVKFFSKSKKAMKAAPGVVASGARKGAAHVGLLLALAIGGIATVAGLTYIANAAKKFQDKFKKVTDFAGKLDKERKALLAKLDEKISPEERAQIMAKIEENRLAALAAADRTTEIVKDSKKYLTDEETKQKAKEAAEEAARIAKYKYLPGMVVKLVEGVRHGGVSDRSKSIALAALITMNERNKVKMKDVFAYRLDYTEEVPEGVDTPVTWRPDGDIETKEMRKDSVRILLSFCNANRDRLHEYLVHRDDITEEEAERRMNNMSIFEYIEECLGSFTAVAGVMKAMEEGEGDIMTRVQNLNMQNVVALDGSVQEHVRGVAARELKLNDEEVAKINVMDMLKSSLKGQDWGPNIASAAARTLPEDASIEDKLLHRIFTEIQGGDTYKYLLPAFHGKFPTDEPGKSDSETVKLYLLHRMPLSMALRMFIYRRMMDNGEASGLFLMQMEVLKFIGREDTGYILKSKRAEAMSQIAKKFLSESSEDFIEGWKDLDIEIEPDVLEKGWHMLHTTFSFAVKEAGDVYLGWLGNVLGVMKDNPGWTATGFSSAAIAYRVKVALGLDPNTTKYNLQQWAKGKETKGIFASAGRNARRLATPVLISQSDDIVECSRAYTEIWEAANKVTGPARKDVMELFRKASVSTHNSYLWTDLAMEMKKLPNGRAAAEACEGFAKSLTLRSVLHRSVYQTKGAFFSWLGLKKPIFLSMRLHNAALDMTVGRLLSIPKYARRLSDANKLASASERVVRYRAFLSQGMTIDEMLIGGAHADDLIKLADDIPVDDLRTVFIHLDDAGKAANLDAFIKVTNGKTPAQLADAGMDLADTAKLMRTHVQGHPTLAAQYSDEVVEGLEKMAKDPEYLQKILFEIGNVEDDALRLAKLDRYIKLVDDDVLLLLKGADAADLISSGKSPQIIIDMCLDTADDAIRQATMAELMLGGHGDDLLNAVEKRAAQAGGVANDFIGPLPKAQSQAAGLGDDLRLVLDAVDDVPESVATRILQFGEPVVAATVVDDVVEATVDVTAQWLKHPAIINMMPKNGKDVATFKQAVKRCGDLCSSPDDAVKLLSKASTYNVLAGSADNYGKFLSAISKSPKVAGGNINAAHRLAMYMTHASTAVELSDDALRAVVATKISYPDELLKFINKCPKINKNPAALAKFIRTKGAWVGAGKFARGAVRVGVGLEAAFFLMTAAEFEAAKQHVKELKSDLNEQLKAAGYTKKAGSKKGEEKYVHPNGSELKVTDMEEIFENVDALDDPELFMRNFQGVMAAGSGVLLLYAPQVLLGPWGIALIGLQVAVTAAVSLWNQSTNRNLMSTLPPPLVALLGTGKIIKESESSLNDSASNWVMTDGLSEGPEDIAEKKKIRKKAYLSLFHRSLANTAAMNPALYQAIVGYAPGEERPEGRRKDDPKTWAELYDEDGDVFNDDYENILRRVMTASLFQAATDSGWEDFWKGVITGPSISLSATTSHGAIGLDWNEFKHLRTDQGGWDWQNVNQLDWEMASQQAVFLYGLHKMEKNAHIARDRHDTAKTAFDTKYPLPPSQYPEEIREQMALQEAKLQELLEEAEKLESQRIFGREIGKAKRADGKTQVEFMLESLESQLDAAARKHGSDREDMRKAGRIFDVRLPDNVSPNRDSDYVNINFLSYAGMEGIHLEPSPQTYTQFLGASMSLEEQIKYIGQVGSTEPTAAWFAQAMHYRLIQNYRMMLLSMPKEYDEGGKILAAIESLDKRNWSTEQTWKYMQKRTDQMHNVTRALRRNNERLQKLRWHYTDFKKEDQNYGRHYMYAWHGDEIPVGHAHPMWDVRDHQKIYFTPRNEDGTYQKDQHKKNQDARVEFAGVPGKTMTWTFPDPNAVAGMSGTLRCISTRKGDYNWEFTADKPSLMYYYTINEYDVEQPGVNKEFDVIPPRTEVLHPTTNEYIHPAATFYATITLKDGGKTHVRFPPLGKDEKVGRDYGRLTKTDQDAMKAELEQLGIAAELIRGVDTSSRRSLWNREKGKRQNYWVKELLGWKFTFDHDSPVANIEFSSNRLADKDPYKQQLDVLPSDEAEAELVKRREAAPETPIHLEASDRLITFPYADALYIDQQDFEMAIELTDGRIIRGTDSYSTQLQRYAAFKPVTPQETYSPEWMNGAWVNVHRKATRGWQLQFRNPDDIQKVVYSTPDSPNRTIIRFTNDGRVPEGDAKDTHEFPLFDIELDAYRKQKFIFDQMNLTKNPTDDSFFNPEGVGKYYPLPDGTVYWTGGLRGDGTISDSLLYDAKVNKKAPGGFELTETRRNFRDEKDYTFKPVAMYNPAERRFIGLHKERERKLSVIEEAQKAVPTLRLMTSGSYSDDETTCMYSFRPNGEFHRSWGSKRGTYEYIPPAKFEGGKWVEIEDVRKEVHIEDLAEQKIEAAKREKKLLEAQKKYADETPPLGWDDPEATYNEHGNKEVAKQAQYGLEIVVEETSIIPANGQRMTVVLNDGSKHEFIYGAPIKGGFFRSEEDIAAQQLPTLYAHSADGEQKQTEAYKQGKVDAELSEFFQEANQSFFDIATEKVEIDSPILSFTPTNETRKETRYTQTMTITDERVAKVIVHTADEEITYTVSDAGELKKAA